MPEWRLPLQKPHIYKKTKRGRASTSAYKGSITIEAAMAVPIFFFAVIALLYLMEIMAVQTAVRCGLQDAGKQLAEETAGISMMNIVSLESKMVNSIGAERLERSIVEGGSGGLDCSASYLSPFSGIGRIHVKYKIRIPLPLFYLPSISYEESMKIKAWTGYEKGGFDDRNEDIVYVTETGMVYHRDYHCTHLDLSIHMAHAAELEQARNTGGARYHACEKCVHGNIDTSEIYITNQGDRYHSSLSCSGLKRTIYAVPVSEAVGKRACSKCGS